MKFVASHERATDTHTVLESRVRHWERRKRFVLSARVIDREIIFQLQSKLLFRTEDKSDPPPSTTFDRGASGRQLIIHTPMATNNGPALLFRLLMTYIWTAAERNGDIKPRVSQNPRFEPGFVLKLKNCLTPPPTLSIDNLFPSSYFCIFFFFAPSIYILHP